MNWYKQLLASPALYNTNRGRNYTQPEPNPKDFREFPLYKDMNKRKKLFNYVKATNQTVTMYHGTLHSRYLAAQQSGYLLGANQTKQIPNAITPKEDRNFVFLTPSKEYAMKSYASPLIITQRTRTQLMAKFKNLNLVYEELLAYPEKYQEYGMLLTFNVPLYAITEVRDAILGGMHERYVGNKLNIVTEDIYGKESVLFDKPDKVVQNLINQITHFDSAPIYTSYLGLPLKWLSNTEKTTDNIYPSLLKMVKEYLVPPNGQKPITPTVQNNVKPD
jgi:hypothetical protein